jgi:WD40 repeat protein
VGVGWDGRNQTCYNIFEGIVIMRKWLGLLFVILLIACERDGEPLTPTAVSAVSTPNGTGVVTVAVETAEHAIQSVPLPALSLITEWEMQTVSAVSWHSSDQIIAISGWDLRGIYGIRLYDVLTGVELWSREDFPSGSIAFTPDGNLIAQMPHYEARVQLLAVNNGNVVSNVVDLNCSTGDWLQFNSSGDSLLTGWGYGHIDWETTLNLWDMPTGQCQALEKRSGLLHFLDVNDNFSLVIMSIVEPERQIYVYDFEKKVDVCKLPGHFGLFIPHTNQFVISNAEKIAFYDVSLCQVVKEFTIDPPLRGYISFNPSGRLFATAGEYLQLWETATGELLFQEKLPDEFFGSGNHPSFVFNRDGDYLLAVFQTPPINYVGNNIIQVWQVTNQE